MDFVQDYRGVRLKGNRIYATALANEDNLFVDKRKYDIILDPKPYFKVKKSAYSKIPR